MPASTSHLQMHAALRKSLSISTDRPARRAIMIVAPAVVLGWRKQSTVSDVIADRRVAQRGNSRMLVVMCESAGVRPNTCCRRARAFPTTLEPPSDLIWLSSVYHGFLIRKGTQKPSLKKTQLRKPAEIMSFGGRKVAWLLFSLPLSACRLS
jgi:hypothetical protein